MSLGETPAGLTHSIFPQMSLHPAQDPVEQDYAHERASRVIRLASRDDADLNRVGRQYLNNRANFGVVASQLIPGTANNFYRPRAMQVSGRLEF